MTEARKIFIADCYTQCVEQIQRLGFSNSMQKALAVWLLGGTTRELDCTGTSITYPEITLKGTRDYRDIAAAGYMTNDVQPTEEILTHLSEALNWLSGREAFSHQTPASYEVDGQALLGIAFGAKALNSQPAIDWLADFLPRSANARLSAHDKAYIAAASAVIGFPNQIPVSKDIDSIDMRVALHSRGLPFESAEQDDADVLRHVLEADISQLDSIHCAAHIRVLDWVRDKACTVDFHGPTVDNLIDMLRRVPASLKRWRCDESGKRSKEGVRWLIENEYHVQDLLWAILAPVFPDLEDEENLPSIGHKHPRADLGIPSLHTIVEVKFLRSAGQQAFAKITEEIAADHSLYLSTGSVYNKNVTFIWDNTCSTEQHDELKQALSKMPGIKDSVIVSRPARLGLKRIAQDPVEG
ncbi:MAG TPA: hypothetical protein PLC40_06880 [Candidatus Hydrogenedentes bacterium]|nr:hypothetical protein [Candidatus Hydrogenedentota bacterium]